MSIDVIKLAREAGFGNEVWPPQFVTHFERFAALVLEEAARICDSVNNYSNPMTANDCADAIRALKPLE